MKTGKRFGQWGVPIFNEKELAKLTAIIRSRPCPVCGAAVGKACRGTINHHMGRLPDSFDSAEAVWGANA
jgi:hypothetical protein